jgi:hypothetical protein
VAGRVWTTAGPKLAGGLRSPTGGPGSWGHPRSGSPATCSPAAWRSVFFPPVRRRRVVVGGGGRVVVGGVGWRSADHRAGGGAASRPHGPPGDGPDTTGPGWPGRWGRHPASGADGGPRTRPAAAHSRGTHSRGRGRPGRCVGRPGRPGWSAPPPAAGWGLRPGPGEPGGRGPQPLGQAPVDAGVVVTIATGVMVAVVAGVVAVVAAGVVAVGGGRGGRWGGG